MNFKSLAILASLVSTLLAPNAHSAGFCASVFGGKKVLLASEATQEILNSLVGSRISYKGKYAYQDPTDKRVISGKGFVESAQLWANDRHPTFSIRFRQDNGNRFTVQTALADATFKLDVKSDSVMEKFENSAISDGLTVQRMKFHETALLRADFFNDSNNQVLRLAVVKETGDPKNPYTVEQIDSVSTKLPSTLEIALSTVDNKPIFLELQTAEGTRQIKFSDIIAIAK